MKKYVKPITKVVVIQTVLLCTSDHRRPPKPWPWWHHHCGISEIDEQSEEENSKLNNYSAWNDEL
jgi:hypothetical protein